MEVSLDLTLVYAPKTISECLKQVLEVEDASQKLSKIDDYVKRLEDERKKIDNLKHELPLCMLLLNDAIMRLKEEATHCKEVNEEQAMIEEVLPSNEDGNDGSDDKRNWMSSVQLWNSNSNDLDRTEQDSGKSKQKLRAEEDDDRSTCENPLQSCNHRNDALFKGLSSGFEGATERKEEKEVVSQVTGLSLMTPAGSELGFCNLIPKTNDCNQMKMKSKPHQPQQLQQHHGSRKQRRSWSPELHRRFVDALRRLGGPEAATPKQIRELMEVDGLTNDEVKSHLQKYRLHLRKLPASSAFRASGLCASQCLNLNNPGSNASCGRLHENGNITSMFNSGTNSMSADDDRSGSDGWNDRHRKAGEVTVN